MDMIFVTSGGPNLVFQPGAAPAWQPPAEVDAVNVEVWLLIADQPFSTAKMVASHGPGSKGMHQYTPPVDRDFWLFTRSFSAAGVPSHPTLEEAFNETKVFKAHQRSTEAPIVKQYGEASETLIQLGIENIDRFARFRRVTIASDEAMTDILSVEVRNSDDYATHELPSVIPIERAGAGAVLANFALASNGSIATADSVYLGTYTAGGAINGDRKTWAVGSGWNADGANTFPNWLAVDFGVSRTITEIDVFSLQDSPGSPIDPTLSTTFSSYGLTDFEAQYWDGSSWLTVPGGHLTGNNKVWAQITFSAITTNKIRILIHDSVDDWSRIVEVEAWGNVSTALPQDIWGMIEHSGGSVWGAASTPQKFTFAGATEEGSAGDFNPIRKDSPYSL